MPLTIDTVSRITGVDGEAASRIVAIASGKMNPLDHPELFPRTHGWVERCFHRLETEEITMAAIDETMGGHGVEPIEPEGAQWSPRHAPEAVPKRS